MKTAAAFAVFALAFAPAASFAQGSPPNMPGPAAGAEPSAPAATGMTPPPVGGLVDPATGRSVTRDGTPGAAPSSGETPSGAPPVGMGRGEK
ncbi:hypothetical protein [Methylocella sp.]|uniref:hypothetical protein n=1 Tax=Methylocella sp. TaxID=1978226 RepID=UPI003784A3F1